MLHRIQQVVKIYLCSPSFHILSSKGQKDIHVVITGFISTSKLLNFVQLITLFVALQEDVAHRIYNIVIFPLEPRAFVKIVVYEWCS